MKNTSSYSFKIIFYTFIKLRKHIYINTAFKFNNKSSENDNPKAIWYIYKIWANGYLIIYTFNSELKEKTLNALHSLRLPTNLLDTAILKQFKNSRNSNNFAKSQREHMRKNFAKIYKFCGKIMSGFYKQSWNTSRFLVTYLR